MGDGIRVDSALRTSDPDIYAAGDVAEFFSPALGTLPPRRARRQCHDDGRNGRRVDGRPAGLLRLSALFLLRSVRSGLRGRRPPRRALETVADWNEPYREGVVYYLRHGRVRGVLLWNVWERVDAARQLIAEIGPFQPDDLHGRLLEIHAHA